MSNIFMETDGIHINLEERAICVSRLLKKVLIGGSMVLVLLGQSLEAHAETDLLHTYSNSLGQEVVNLIAVSPSKLLPLLPAGYTLAPASSVGFGQPDQGLVAIVNYRSTNQTVDGKNPSDQNQIAAIDVGILVTEPTKAVEAGVNISGAYHFYLFAIYTNDYRYAASLRQADIPVEFVNKIGYQRDMNDATGVGDLIVSVPSKESPFKSFNHSDGGYLPATGAINAVFWHNGNKGPAVLHYQNQPFQQGTAISRIYTKPTSTLGTLFEGGGLGSCPPHAETDYSCVNVPSLNLRYDEGGDGTLVLLR